MVFEPLTVLLPVLEDVHMLRSIWECSNRRSHPNVLLMNIETGVDLDKAANVGVFLENLLKRPLLVDITNSIREKYREVKAQPNVRHPPKNSHRPPSWIQSP